MSTVPNEVFDQPFSAIEMTNAINRMPATEASLDSEFTWTVTRSPTTGVRINSSEGKLDIAPYVPRGGVPPVLHGTNRSAITVDIPGLAARATVMNREALNVTAGLNGETRLTSLEMLRDQKNQQISRALDRAEARQSAEAIRGLLTNPAPYAGQDGYLEVIQDLYKLQGVDQIEVDLDLTDSKLGLNEQVEEIKEISERKIGDAAAIRGFKLIAGNTASGLIRNSKDFKELLTSPLAQYMAKVDGRKTVPINDNVEIVQYKYGHFAADEAYLVPIYDGHAQIVYGPSEVEEFWGNVLPRYVTSEPMGHGKGMELEGWAYVLRYFQHPEAILKVNVIGAR